MGNDEEPLWRARARVVGVVFLVLVVLAHLADDEPGLLGVVGPILAGVLLWFRKPVGVAVLVVNVVMELLDVFVSYRDLGFIGALGQMSFVFGLGAITLVHGRFISDFGVTQWRSCRVEIVHGYGVSACALVHGDTTAEHLSELTDAISTMRWDP